MLKHHFDGSLNFQTKLVTQKDEITSSNLTELINELFDDNEEIEVALFYFSGHGHVDNIDGYLVTSDAMKNNYGIRTTTLQRIISQSKVRNKIIILDCCYSGSMGHTVTEYGLSSIAEIPKNTTILSASRKSEPAKETVNGGVFTSLLIEALYGGCCDILGNITPASIYYYIDKSLGCWGQRPVFKTHTCQFISIRKTNPLIPFEILKKIIVYFPNPDEELKLDPSFEPDSQEPDKINNEIFANLQKFRAIGLVIPVGTEHMYYAAMESKSCKLTTTGLQYWKLVKNNKI